MCLPSAAGVQSYPRSAPRRLGAAAAPNLGGADCPSDYVLVCVDAACMRAPALTVLVHPVLFVCSPCIVERFPFLGI